MKRLRFCLFLFALAAIGLAACSGGTTPKMIASYPQTGAPVPLPREAIIVYDGFLEMEVSSLDKAADRAENLATSYGGYLESSQSWYQDSHKYVTIVLVVPAPNFDGLRVALHDLGTLKSETITGQPVNTYGGSEWTQYSHITVQLRPKARVWPSFPSTGWNPLNTASSAFDVFITIFGFLADVVIWVAIVVGPFVLIGLGVRWIIRRGRKKSS